MGREPGERRFAQMPTAVALGLLAHWVQIRFHIFDIFSKGKANEHNTKTTLQTGVLVLGTHNLQTTFPLSELICFWAAHSML